MNESSDKATGTLFVVATPIGNLKDITLRAIEVLQACDWVACEDTRHSQRLFQAHGIDSKTLALHQHNENQQAQSIIDRLLQGHNVALVSDAGTPLISDPGFPLIQLAHEQQLSVVPIPGPSALIALLSVAGLNTNPFTFHGFLPAKSQQRIKALEAWLPLSGTHVFYESAHRIVACVDDLLAVFGATTPVAMGRELTKTFEQVFRGSLNELTDLIVADRNHQKGEFVLAIQGQKADTDEQLTPEQRQLASQLQQHLPPKTAAKVVADHYGINKKQVYQFMLDAKAP
ncbi:16S rRNA (cytidine(1402)-2'-O)-methyltransferase [Marinicella meishanensis]|uniref:16S rRNA (cytidine(1402)-2'-O)-methyltransferase n=1 Tax=Marinicella meishanensis TaxID=2873263 RepID=UPI001CC0538F|nr:16S rRNA (cytidine(1402)-2'-O)-methyltransferase [Marinicella sp. NBU2979]